MSRPEVLRRIGLFQAALANDKDYLPTRISYKLNLEGPSVNVRSACSTALVGVHLAWRAGAHLLADQVGAVVALDVEGIVACDLGDVGRRLVGVRHVVEVA